MNLPTNHPMTGARTGDGATEVMTATETETGTEIGPTTILRQRTAPVQRPGCRIRILTTPSAPKATEVATGKAKRETPSREAVVNEVRRKEGSGRIA